jgi:thiamine pyrophosphate-dependent acetolactate synthase large subunit-like protein
MEKADAPGSDTPPCSIGGSRRRERKRGFIFFRLAAGLPRDGIVVTDSGLHQGLVRRHFEVSLPAG